MTPARNVSEPSETNGVGDTEQKLYLAQLRDELKEWVEDRLTSLWASLDSKASKSAVATLITIALVLIGVFSGGIVYVSQIDKEVTVNTTKIESIEETIKGQNQMLQDILNAVNKQNDNRR